MWLGVGPVWKACGGAAIQEEFQILDRYNGNPVPCAFSSCSICHPALFFTSAVICISLSSPHTSTPPPLSQIGVDRMARGSSFEGDRAVSVAAMMMCDLKLTCSKTAMLTGAKCKRCCALFDNNVPLVDVCVGYGECKEVEGGVEVSVKRDGEVDVLLMERDAAGVPIRVVAIAEMKSGAYDLACGEQQHAQ